MRLGNLLYYLAYIYSYCEIGEDVVIHTNNPHFEKIKRILNIPNLIIQYTTHAAEPFCLFAEILDSSLSGFEKINQYLVKKRIPHIAVICLRLGDYLEEENENVYKTVDVGWLDCVLQKHKDALLKNNTIVLSDDIKKAGSLYGKTIAKYVKAKYTHTSAIEDFNLLLNSSFTIGSCSTFCFAAHCLNDTPLVVEYPYYKQPNPRGFGENKEKKLYNHPNIIIEK